MRCETSYSGHLRPENFFFLGRTSMAALAEESVVGGFEVSLGKGSGQDTAASTIRETPVLNLFRGYGLARWAPALHVF